MSALPGLPGAEKPRRAGAKNNYVMMFHSPADRGLRGNCQSPPTVPI